MDIHLRRAIEANNGKAIIFNQFFGLGDILFCEPIARKYHNDGYIVIWPIEDKYFWLNTYIDYVHFRNIGDLFRFDYEQCNDDYTYNGIPVLPLRFSNPLLRGLAPHDGSDRNNWMNDKYERLNLPVKMWKSLKWTRNEAKEDALFTQMIGLGHYEYAFANTYFGGGFQDCGATIKTDLPVVQMHPVPGFTMLDWAKVICNAKEIHTVETSVIYMIEALPVKAKKWHMYPRKPWDTTLDQVKNIITKSKWVRPISIQRVLL